MQNLPELKSYLSVPKNIVITSHRNPDGDAIGSSLGLYHYLMKFGHSVRVVFPSEYPHFLAWMKNADEILIYDIDPERSDEYLKKADIVFCLDYNSLDRVDKMGETIGSLKEAKIAMIDHHLYPDIQADYSISETTASSTSELVFDFIQMLGDLAHLDPIIGECLFTGILTDTGSFKYSTSAKLFRIVAHLLEIGVDDDKLQDLIFNSMDKKSLRLLGHCLWNRMEIIEEFKTGIIHLTKEDYETFDIQRGDTEGIVNFLLKLKNVKFAAFVTEQPTIVKISLRSKGDFSVQEIAKKHFKGGGHKNASGGASFTGLKSTLRKLKEILPNYKEQLNA
ncbi:MAG: bifunctional oligoribonuclease/PAP phosphatase NrnA [Saprospiraceae bacterium]